MRTDLLVLLLLQALCRLATLKAFPTDEEIAAAGSSCPNAAAYLANLQLNFADKYHTLQEERKGIWGKEPSQPLHRCVEHLWSLLVVALGLNTGADGKTTGEQELTMEQMRTWINRAMVSSTPGH